MLQVIDTKQPCTSALEEHCCIEKKQGDCDGGTAFTVDGLMNQASNKFKTLVQAG